LANRYLLRPSLHRVISEGGSANNHLGRSAARGKVHCNGNGNKAFHDRFAYQVLTKDSVTVSVDAVVYYRVSNATVSVANVENAHHSTRLLAQTTLRNILGTKNLHEILSDRESISSSMQVYIRLGPLPRPRPLMNLLCFSRRPCSTRPPPPGALRWNEWKCECQGRKENAGEKADISPPFFLCSKDARLPVQLQRAMAAEAEAAREARAKVRARKKLIWRWLKEFPAIVHLLEANFEWKFLPSLSIRAKETVIVRLKPQFPRR